MSFKALLRSCLFCLALAQGGFASPAPAKSCVWRVYGPNNTVLYLGGSVHALRKSDYPLPAAYTQALDASQRLAFEVDDKALHDTSEGLEKSGVYPKNDSLKNHVDPRTYDYLRRFFRLLNMPEATYSQYKPWFIALVLQTPELHGLSSDLGVEGYLTKRARSNGKPISGLESAREHAEIFSGLSDRQSETYLLLTFIPHGGDDSGPSMLESWRRGDADALTRMTKADLADFPSFRDRLLDARNRNWIPKIEGYLRSGKTYFVVVGAAHLGGPNGVVALLQKRGYRVEQL